MKHRKGHWDPKASAASNARRELPLFAEEYFAAGRKAVRKTTTAARLHEFRLATKHFRYLLELFLPLYSPALEAFFQHLRRVQTLLGELNDYTVTRAMVGGKRKKAGAEAQVLLAYLDSQEKKKLVEFRRFWKDEFDIKGAEAQWMAYLSRSRRAPAARQKVPH